jgi:hypothetical protein
VVLMYYNKQSDTLHKPQLSQLHRRVRHSTLLGKVQADQNGPLAHGHGSDILTKRGSTG